LHPFDSTYYKVRSTSDTGVKMSSNDR